MKPNIKKRKKHDTVDLGQKFIAEQNYAEQGTILEDPRKDIPEYVDEEGITTTNEESEETKNEDLI